MYRTTKKVVQRGSLSVVVALGALATGIGVAGASTHSPHATGKSHSTGLFTSNKRASDKSHHDGGFGQVQGVRGLITAVSASSITIQGKGGTPATYTIDGTTTVTIGGATSSAASLTVGERVLITSTTAGIAASIVVSHVELGNDGVVTAASLTSITLTDDESKLPVTFTISGTTIVTQGGATVAASALAIGQFVKVLPVGTTSVALSIAIRGEKKAMCVSGVVTAASLTSITVQGKTGTLPVTFLIDGSTKVFEGRTAAAASNLAVGERVRVNASPGSPTTAGTIEIDLTSVYGQVVSVTGNNIVVSNRGGLYETVVVSGTTKYTLAGASSTLAAVTPGSFIFAEGLVDSTHTMLDAIAVGIGQGGGIGHHSGFGGGFGGGLGHKANSSSGRHGGHNGGGRR